MTTLIIEGFFFDFFRAKNLKMDYDNHIHKQTKGVIIMDYREAAIKVRDMRKSNGGFSFDAVELAQGVLWYGETYYMESTKSILGRYLKYLVERNKPQEDIKVVTAVMSLC